MRADLLELTVPVLTALANAGLVKRAQREVEQGKLFDPQVVEDGAISVSTDDGNTVTFPMGSGFEGTCTCGGAGVCRHRIGAVLRYQAWALTAFQGAEDEPDGGGLTPKSPESIESTASPASAASTESTGDRAQAGATGDATGASASSVSPPNTLPIVDDPALAAALAPKTLTRAEAARKRGYVATVRPAEPEDDQPCVVELGTTTVTFLLGPDLRYTRCDCKARTACEHVALAVWAVQEALKIGEGRDEHIVAVGGSPAKLATDADSRTAVTELIALVLHDGLAHMSTTLAYRLATTTRIAERAGQQWIVLLLTRLGELHAAYERRGALDVRQEATDVLAGLAARLRATRPTRGLLPGHSDASMAGVALPASVVLGTSERAETPLGQIRLTGAGASVLAGDEPGGCRVEIAVVEPASSTILLARRSFRPPGTEPSLPAIGGGTAGAAGAAGAGPSPLEGAAVAQRSLVKGVSITAAATGAIVTNAAVRRPDRVIALRVGGLRRTSASAGSASATRFAEAGLVTTPSAVLAERRARPPRLLRPLLATEDVVAFHVNRVEHTTFNPAEQRVEVIATCGEEQFALVAEHRDLAPGAPGALAAFADEIGPGPGPGPSTGPGPGIGIGIEQLGLVVGRAFVNDGLVAVRPSLLIGSTVRVPDLTAMTEAGRAAVAALPVGQAFAGGVGINVALADAQTLLGDLAVEGMGAGQRWIDRASAVSQTLRRQGLPSVAERVERLRVSVTAASVGSSSSLVEPWADLAIALAVAAELVAGRTREELGQ